MKSQSSNRGNIISSRLLKYVSYSSVITQQGTLNINTFFVTALVTIREISHVSSVTATVHVYLKTQGSFFPFTYRSNLLSCFSSSVEAKTYKGP